MTEEASSNSKSFINRKEGKAFIAGFSMSLVCGISSMIWRPLQDSTFLYCLGSLGTFVMLLLIIQAVLKRFGFEGFDVTERNSFGKGSAYLSFFAGIIFSFFGFMVMAILITIATSYLGITIP